MTLRTLVIRLLALGVMGGAAILGRQASRVVHVPTEALASNLGSIGPWQVKAAEEAASEAGGAVVKQVRTYGDPAGHRIDAIFVSTATRIGALRDYSVPAQLGGWVGGNRRVVEGPMLPTLGQPMRYLLEDLHHGPNRRLAVTWYVCSRSQAADLASAELAGWWSMVASSRPPLWLQVYAGIDAGKQPDEARRLLTGFADAIGPELARLAGEAPAPVTESGARHGRTGP